MKIQVKSDLHHEFWWNQTRPYHPDIKGPNYICPEADVIVLAGDIVNTYTLESLISVYGSCGKPVVYVPGNHEYYGVKHISDMRKILKSRLENTDIVLLDTDWKVINNVLFIGATLWTNLSNPLRAHAIEYGMNDFRYIGGMGTAYWTQMYKDDKEFINKVLLFDQFRGMKKVVVTHYLPSWNSVHPKFAGSDLNYAFVGDCEDILEEPWAPDLWAHGHTHESFDYKKGNSRVICNPYGYWGEELNSNFKPDLLIEV